MRKLVLKDEPLTHKGCLAPCGKWVELTTVLGTVERVRAHTQDLNYAVKALAF